MSKLVIVLLIVLAGCSKLDSTSRQTASIQQPPLLTEEKMCADQGGWATLAGAWSSFRRSGFYKRECQQETHPPMAEGSVL
jgi:hypothetical protein